MTATLLLVIGGFAAGFIDSIAGGGGLISLPTLLALGLPPTVALGSNKLIAIATGIASSTRYSAARSIDWKTMKYPLLMGCLTAMAGAWCATRINPAVLRPLILTGLISVALYLVFKRKFGLTVHEKRLKHPLWPVLFVAPLGFYDGFFGPGTGTFLMMGFAGLFGQELLAASAHSRAVNLFTTVGSFTLFAATGFIDFRFVFPAAIASFIGGLCGATFSLKKGARGIRPVFVAVVWMLIAKVSWDFFRY